MRLMLMFLGIVMVGCATQGKNTMSYTEGSPVKIINEVQVDAPYSRVWDTLVRDLAKSFYVINNIDRESRLLNVSFTTADPESYIELWPLDTHIH